MNALSTSDLEFLSKLSTYICNAPERFAQGGRLLDGLFSRSEMRRERAFEIRDWRRGKHVGSEVMLVMTDQFNYEFGRHRPYSERRWRKHCRTAQIDPERWAPRVSPPDLVGRPRSNPNLRLRKACEWAAEQRVQFMSLEVAQAVCLVVWLCWDRAAEEVRPILCEFQTLPWDPLHEVEHESMQGRGVRAPFVSPELIAAARGAMGVVESSVDPNTQGSPVAKTKSVPSEGQAQGLNQIEARCPDSTTRSRIINVLTSLQKHPTATVSSSEIRRLGIPLETVFSASKNWKKDVDYFGAGTARRTYSKSKLVEWVINVLMPLAKGRQATPRI